MSYKTRSNYAPCYNLTEEEFNKIFGKEENGPSKFETKEERKQVDNIRNMDK